MSELTDRHAYLVVYDGDCGLCARSVQFILKHDRAGRYRFSPHSSPLGKALCAEAGLDAMQPSSLIAIVDRTLHTKSRAVLAVASSFGGPWTLVGCFRLVPRAVADRLYDWVARRRKSFFPSASHCLASPELRSRILLDP